jgi:hypothetical protein
VVYTSTRERVRALSRGENGFSQYSRAVKNCLTYELDQIPENYYEVIISFMTFVSIQEEDSEIFKVGQELCLKIKGLSKL